MPQEQERPQRPGVEPETRELDPMQRPDDMPQLDEDRRLDQEQPDAAPQEWTEPRPGADAAPPVGSELEPATEGAGDPRLTEQDAAPA